MTDENTITITITDADKHLADECMAIMETPNNKPTRQRMEQASARAMRKERERAARMEKALREIASAGPSLGYSTKIARAALGE